MSSCFGVKLLLLLGGKMRHPGNGLRRRCRDKVEHEEKSACVTAFPVETVSCNTSNSSDGTLEIDKKLIR